MHVLLYPMSPAHLYKIPSQVWENLLELIDAQLGTEPVRSLKRREPLLGFLLAVHHVNLVLEGHVEKVHRATPWKEPILQK